jgi:dolichyl-phosphate-mannose--protein O-mannosyl transferase
MKLQRVFAGIVFMSCVIFLGISSVSRLKNIPYERDEISWYFHTKFLDEVMIEKRLFSPLWQGYESYDHPPVSKYIYGTYLYLSNQDYARERDKLEKKYGRWNMYYTIKSDQDIANTEFVPILYELRRINTVFALFILVEIFILSYMLSRSVWVSLALCAALSFNSVFMNSAAVITSDNHFLFFSLLAIICYVRSLTSKQWWLIGAAVATSLAVGSKLIGLFVFLAVVVNEIAGLAYQSASVKKTLTRMALYSFLSFAGWIVINPALYTSPFFNTWRYFAFRNFQSANIAYFVPEAALGSSGERARAVVCTLVIRSCTPHTADASFSSSNVLNVLLLLLGIAYSWRAVQKKRRAIIFLILLGYCIVAGYLVFLSNYGQRYFVLLQVILFVIEMLAVQWFAQRALQKIKPLTRLMRGLY